MITLTDQLGRVITLPHPPKRIISTVPSQTELLFDLGLDNEIAGVTKFCIHPANKVKNKVNIGGTKQLNIPLICSLNPDLIIANKEENNREQIEELANTYPTYISDPDDLHTALQKINDVGALINRQKPAQELVAAIAEQFNNLRPISPTLKVAYFIWRKPYMVAGTGTFINDMLQRCGFTNAFTQQRYPEITLEQLLSQQPDLVLLSSEPYPFKQKHVDELSSALPGVPIKLVDGELFSWYGSRLMHSAAYFIKLINSVQQ